MTEYTMRRSDIGAHPADDAAAFAMEQLIQARDSLPEEAPSDERLKLATLFIRICEAHKVSRTDHRHLNPTDNPYTEGRN